MISLSILSTASFSTGIGSQRDRHQADRRDSWFAIRLQEMELQEMNAPRSDLQISCFPTLALQLLHGAIRNGAISICKWGFRRFDGKVLNCQIPNLYGSERDLEVKREVRCFPTGTPHITSQTFQGSGKSRFREPAFPR